MKLTRASGDAARTSISDTGQEALLDQDSAAETRELAGAGAQSSRQPRASVDGEGETSATNAGSGVSGSRTVPTLTDDSGRVWEISEEAFPSARVPGQTGLSELGNGLVVRPGAGLIPGMMSAGAVPAFIVQESSGSRVNPKAFSKQFDVELEKILLKRATAQANRPIAEAERALAAATTEVGEQSARDRLAAIKRPSPAQIAKIAKTLVPTGADIEAATKAARSAVAESPANQRSLWDMDSLPPQNRISAPLNVPIGTRMQAVSLDPATGLAQAREVPIYATQRDGHMAPDLSQLGGARLSVPLTRADHALVAASRAALATGEAVVWLVKAPLRASFAAFKFVATPVAKVAGEAFNEITTPIMQSWTATASPQQKAFTQKVEKVTTALSGAFVKTIGLVRNPSTQLAFYAAGTVATGNLAGQIIDGEAKFYFNQPVATAGADVKEARALANGAPASSFTGFTFGHGKDATDIPGHVGIFNLNNPLDAVPKASFPRLQGGSLGDPKPGFNIITTTNYMPVDVTFSALAGTPANNIRAMFGFGLSAAGNPPETLRTAGGLPGVTALFAAGARVSSLAGVTIQNPLNPDQSFILGDRSAGVSGLIATVGSQNIAGLKSVVASSNADAPAAYLAPRPDVKARLEAEAKEMGDRTEFKATPRPQDMIRGFAPGFARTLDAAQDQAGRKLNQFGQSLTDTLDMFRAYRGPEGEKLRQEQAEERARRQEERERQQQQQQKRGQQPEETQLEDDQPEVVRTGPALKPKDRSDFNPLTGRTLPADVAAAPGPNPDDREGPAGATGVRAPKLGPTPQDGGAQQTADALNAAPAEAQTAEAQPAKLPLQKTFYNMVIPNSLWVGVLTSGALGIFDKGQGGYYGVMPRSAYAPQGGAPRAPLMGQRSPYVHYFQSPRVIFDFGPKVQFVDSTKPESLFRFTLSAVGTVSKAADGNRLDTGGLSFSLTAGPVGLWGNFLQNQITLGNIVDQANGKPARDTATYGFGIGVL